MKTRPTTTGGLHQLDEKPGHLVRRAHQLSVTIFSEETRKFRITGPQHVVLVALAHHAGVDQNTVASLVALDRSTAGNVIVRLERRGLIVRAVNPADHRGRLLSLTAKGRKLVAAMDDAVRRTQQRFLATLDPAEQAQFITFLRRIVGLED
ncbi:MarR family winged helix-turn-helix transcriptional regulator [Reyranella sp. CPCC 100927]|uniref:MarR family winged helix-turn-helix transcriptional regulator n=1 Tax=Reyranella sp. CPCC 100927 TaxID=2599616 RepID=UPI0011B7F2DE|nr:MarR family transcriptional regulator [Reyranella sp. CPCC 100927]TWT10236.1 MarR family transcriptional regulator [Reyranella sp. CPCC 100927]